METRIIGQGERRVDAIGKVTGRAKFAADATTQRRWPFCKPCQKPLPNRAPNEWWANMAEVFDCD